MLKWINRWLGRVRYIKQMEEEVDRMVLNCTVARAVLVEWHRTMPQRQQSVAKNAIASLDRSITHGRDGDALLAQSFEGNDTAFLVLPRVILEAMGNGWKVKFGDVMGEYRAAYPNAPTIQYRVQAVRNGKLASVPPSIMNYEEPNVSMLAVWRKKDWMQ